MFWLGIGIGMAAGLVLGAGAVAGYVIHAYVTSDPDRGLDAQV
jgi:hypothetical protein